MKGQISSSFSSGDLAGSSSGGSPRRRQDTDPYHERPFVPPLRLNRATLTANLVDLANNGGSREENLPLNSLYGSFSDENREKNTENETGLKPLSVDSEDTEVIVFPAPVCREEDVVEPGFSYWTAFLSYMKNRYPREAISAVAVNLIAPLVLLNALKMAGRSDIADDIAGTIEEYFLSWMGQYAPLGFPLFGIAAGALGLVPFGKAVDTIAELCCGLVTKLQRCGYLPQPNDDRIHLFILPFTYYPALPFTVPQTLMFIASQVVLQEVNNGLGLADIKDTFLQKAFEDPVFCALLPAITKTTFAMVAFLLYFGTLVRDRGFSDAVTRVQELDSKVERVKAYLLSSKWVEGSEEVEKRLISDTSGQQP